MNIYKLVLPAIPLVMSGCSHVAFAGGCLHEAPRDAGIAVDGATNVRIVAGAGSLDVVGKAGMSAVEAHGTACAAKESQLDGIRLIAERRGDTLWIESVFEEGLSFGNRGLSFTVELPDSLPLEVQDGSGALIISNVAALRLVDGSGQATISGVHGDLTVDDGSGGLDISDIHGSVRIEDGSGSLDIKEIHGDLTIRDGSGGISIRQVVGAVRLRDGSGGISVDGVEGDLTISEAGSGGVDVHNISGRVDIPKKR